MTEDKVFYADVLESDHPYDHTWHSKCSRCREPLNDDVPLILWKVGDKKLAYVYCPSCSDDVIGSE